MPRFASSVAAVGAEVRPVGVCSGHGRTAQRQQPEIGSSLRGPCRGAGVLWKRTGQPRQKQNTNVHHPKVAGTWRPIGKDRVRGLENHALGLRF